MHDIFSSSEANMDDSKSAKASYYTKALKALIDDFVSRNGDIDGERIYIMGAGSGGYMALNMCVEYPDFFAAAVPVSEEYPDSKLTDDEIADLAQMPLWFVYSTEDETVDSAEFSAATLARLKDAGASQVRQSVFKEIRAKSSDGKERGYDAHKCWIPLFRGECRDGREELFGWLSQQRRGRRDIIETDAGTDGDAERNAPRSAGEGDGWGISDTPPVVL